MDKIKRLLEELRHNKKKRKTLIIAGIVVVTLIATVATISITGVSSPGSGGLTGINTTNTTPVGAEEAVLGNATDNPNPGQLTDQFDPSIPASVGVRDADNPGSNEVTTSSDVATDTNTYNYITKNSTADTPAGRQVSVVCSIAVDCSSISGNGALSAAGKPWLEPYADSPDILPATTMEVFDANGDGRVGVDEAIKQACNDYGIQYEFKGSSYLRGMNYLYEFDAGPNSGWMYSVGGRNPNRGCNSYYLSGGEDIRWYYVISY